MMDQNEFDELARRKLAERQFPFQEAHWNDMEKVLDAGKRRRRVAGWWLFPALLLLIGGGGAFLYFSNDPEQKEVLATKQQEKPIESDVSPSPLQSIADPIDSETTVSKIETPITEVEVNQVETIVPIEEPAKAISTEQQLNDVSRIDRNVEPTNVSDNKEVSQEPAVEVAIEEPMDVDPNSEEANRPAADPFEENVVVTDPMQDPFFTISEAENDPTETGNDLVDDLSSTEASTTVDNTTDEAAGDVMARSEEGSADVVREVSEADNVVSDDPIGSEDITGNISENDDEAIENEEPQEDYVTQQDPATDDVSADEPAPTDSITTTDPAASDPLVSPEPQATPTPIVDPRSPFEIGIHAGLLFTTSNYGGPQSEGQFRSIERQRNYAGGMEFMRMGRNIGVGSGIHYSTYSERITMDHIDRTESAQSQYYFLTPVDTTLLIISDSMEVNGIMQYIGQSVYTTVHVLDQGMQTITTNTRVRDAREQLNRTSYLEIPLLFDIHVVQGRWNLGLRGGPTLGILSTSSGSIPNSTYDGYLDLNDQQFRSLVLGYTGRAYLRYRFNAAWSIGLEPTVRGHLQNGLEGDQLTRRPIGYGGMFSLNYRFR